jgi:hypothetical protein
VLFVDVFVLFKALKLTPWRQNLQGYHAKVGREDTFKPEIGNESSHEISFATCHTEVTYFQLHLCGWPDGFRLNCKNCHPPEQFITTRVKYTCSSVSALGNVDRIDSGGLNYLCFYMCNFSYYRFCLPSIFTFYGHSYRKALGCRLQLVTHKSSSVPLTQPIGLYSVIGSRRCWSLFRNNRFPSLLSFIPSPGLFDFLFLYLFV